MSTTGGNAISFEAFAGGSGRTYADLLTNSIAVQGTGTAGVLFGDPNAPDGGISRLGAASLAIGNGTAGDYSGNLKLTSVTATTATITTGNIATLVSPAATITTATITNDHIANAFITTATVTSTLELQTATIVDSLGSTGTVGQALESTGTGVKWAAVSSTETWAALTGAMTATQVAPWYNATSTIDSGISRLGAASLAIGNGTAGDYTGLLSLSGVSVGNGTGAGANQTFLYDAGGDVTRCVHWQHIGVWVRQRR